MIPINMKITQNYAKFTDEQSNTTIYVDSFDNITFNVRVGTIEQSQCAGSIIALSDKDLQTKLTNILNEHISK